MAVRAATFTGFDPYKLTGVRVTDRELGHGSYATVLELKYMGLKCAGKKIHELLLRQGDASYTVRRFEEECRLLSQVRHPNIVQFLGVYFQQGVRAPILVMEFLPTNLTSCIEQYGILPKEISYSILHDVALGLCYLHSQTPAIIHRDLSSNNVLLTPNMTAKISDLGVARILNLTPLQVSRMTQTPGTPAYMPPEVMIANPKYDTSVDEFSYGIMMIHMFSVRWPEPQVGQTRIEADRLIPVTEAERREVFLRTIGNDHPLMDFILKCINNDPRRRAHASEIVERLAELVLQFPSSFTSRLEMLRQIESDVEENRILREEKKRAFQEKEEQILSLKEEARRKSEEIDRLSVSYSSELEQMKLEIGNLNSEHQLLIAKNEAEVVELKAKVTISEAQIENTDKTLKQEREDFATQLTKEKNQSAAETEQLEIQLAKEKELSRALQSEMSQLMSRTKSLQYTNSNLEADISRKDANTVRNEAELETLARNLQEKDAVIVGMKEQLSKMRKYLTTKQQVSSSCASIIGLHKQLGDE